MHIVITTLGLDLKTPTGRLVFGMMSQIAEFERELIRERVKAGMTEARKRGVHTGRKHTLKPHQRAEAARLHQEGKSLGAIAALFGCGRSVVHRAVQPQLGADLTKGETTIVTKRSRKWDVEIGPMPGRRAPEAGADLQERR